MNQDRQKLMPPSRAGTRNEWGDVGAMRDQVASVCEAWLRVLASPRVRTFITERRDATWERTGVSLGLIALCWGVSRLLHGSLDGALRSGVFHAGLALLASAVLFVAARTVGRGMGDYRTQTYLYLLYHAPLSCTLAVIAVMPVFGTLAALVAAPIFACISVILSFPMLQAAHGMGRWRALLTLVTLLAIAAVLVLALVLLAVVLAMTVHALLLHLLG